jgi:membrane protein DedA with SNARE-associated domain
MFHDSTFFLILLAQFGWLGNWLFLFIALVECIPLIGAFFPGGTLITLAGFFAAQGYFPIENIILFALIGAIAGDYLSYLLGRWGSNWLLAKGLVKPTTIDKGEKFFQQYGAKSLLWGRFIGATRSLIPFIAGASKMKQRTFLTWNIAGAIIWATFSSLLGYFSGNLIITIVRRWSHRLGLIVILMAAIWLIYWLTKKHGQSIQQYFRQQSRSFVSKMATTTLVNRLDKEKIVTSDIVQGSTSQEWLFGLFLWIIIISTLYLLTIFLGLF